MTSPQKLSERSIESLKKAAKQLGLERTNFQAMDARFAQRVQALVDGVDVDLSAPLSPADD